MIHRIERFQQEDAEAVTDCWLQSTKQAHPFIDSAYWENHQKTMINQYLPDSETWVFKNGANETGGFYSLTGNHLKALFVRPELQNSGIGSLMMEKIKSSRREVELRVYKNNRNAIHFYEKHGFSVEAEQTDSKTNEPELVMKWKQT